MSYCLSCTQLILICFGLYYCYQILLDVGWNHSLGKKRGKVGLSVQGASLCVVQSGGFSSEICDQGWRRWEVRWVRRFKTMKRSSDDPQTSNHFISIYLSASSITDCLTDQAMQSTVPPPLALGGHPLFILSAFQRNILFHMVCTLHDSALQEFCLTNFNIPFPKPPLQLR